jgi:hypothetical protein
LLVPVLAATLPESQAFRTAQAEKADLLPAMDALFGEGPGVAALAVSRPGVPREG